MSGFAWVTLATNDSYSLGALVLAHSLRQVGTAHQLAVLVTPGVSGVMREKLSSVFNVVREVNVLDSRDEANLRLLQRPDLGITFTKLHCWRLTQFNKCVFLDADTLVLQNADELFEREEFSAAPDVGWPDCFNSGVFVYCPSEDTYGKLVQFALEKGSFDGGDQGLLNLYFSDWAHKDISKHLPFIYNMCSTAGYSYLPAFKQFGGNVKIIHFIGNTKPWLQYFDTETRQVNVANNLHHIHGFVQQWWNLFCSLVHPSLSSEMAGLAGAFAKLTMGVPRTAEQRMLEDHLRRQGWEVGNIDYMGRDSFDNIWSKICETLSDGASAQPAPAQPEPARPEPAQATDPSPAAVPEQPQQVPEAVKASEIDSAPKEPPAKAAEVPIAAVQPKTESVPQADISPKAEVQSTALPSEAPKAEESCPKPISPAETKPAAESCLKTASAAVTSETKPSEPESPKPAPLSPSDSSKPASVVPSEPRKESAVCQKPSTPPSDIPQPAAVPESPKPEAVAQPPSQAPKVSPQQGEAKQLVSEKPAEAVAAPLVSQQAAPSAPSPKAEAAPAPAQPQKAPPSSPKTEAAPVPPKSQQTAPSSPAPKAQAASTPPSSPAPKAEAAAPKLPQTPKTEAAPVKSQKSPPSLASAKAEGAAAPAKSQQTPPPSPSPKSQGKAAPLTKEAAAEAPSSPAPSAQSKGAPAKKAAPTESSAPEKAPADEAGAAAGGQGPTPPPRKTGGGGSTKKSGKGKK